MAIEVFNRQECKFLIHKSIYKDIENRILKYMELDDYNKEKEFYTISNIYYDTEDNYLIRTSLCKPTYKEKLRLRAYGIPKGEDKVFLEVKKKVNGFGNKRRTKLELQEAYEFFSTGKKPEIKNYMNKQVINEVEYIFKTYHLKPKLYIAYDRRAFFYKENRNLRITFDENIRTRRYDLALEKGDYGENLLQEDEILMEIKTDYSIPLWLCKLLSEYKIFKRSFSKYGNEYEKMLLSNTQLKGEMKPCLNQYLTQPQLIHQFF